jgi:tetratricopeptide (TPR) repeat protein
MKAITQSLLKVLELLPGIGQSLRVINMMHAIRRREEERKWAEARALRSAALKQVAAGRSAPLWRSEGEDLLYNRRDPAGALAAFQHAEHALVLSSSLYGVAAPDRIFAGAAQAALALGKRDEALAHFRKLSELVAELSRHGMRPDALAWHQEVLAKLKQQLAETT